MHVETPSFYVTGGTLRGDAPSYVERQADRDLFQGLLAGEYCYVLNTRQMGKSSLMVRTAARLRAAGVSVVILDLTAIGQNLSPEQWYEGLLVSLGQQLRLEDALDDFWLEHPQLGPLQRLTQALEHVVLPALGPDGRLVLFVDEIDAVRSLPFSADEFFAAVRECYNRRTRDPAFERLTCCLLGVATPADLITETRMSPFNVGRRIRITDFTAEEAAPLAAGVKGGVPVLERVLYWTGGQPYLTQALCRAVAAAGVVQRREVDALCGGLFLSKQARESDDHLAFVRNRLLRSEADLASLLDLYQKVRSGKRVADDETNPLCAILKLSGVAREVDGLLRVRNRIYDRVFDREWVTEHMPDAEVRRQRAAYRRGLVRATALASGVVTVTGGLAVYAFGQKSMADRNARLLALQVEAANYNLYVADMNLIQSDWDSGNVARLEDLLRETLRYPGRGFEWHYWNRLRHLDLLTLNHARLWSAAFSPDGRQIVTSALGAVKVWDARSGRELVSLNGHTRVVRSAAFSSDSRRVVTASWDGTAKVWDSESGRELLTCRGHTLAVWGAAFSPDGARIATGSADGTAKVWEARVPPGEQLGRGRATLTLRGHTAQVHDVTFSPDGRRVVTGSADGTARVWDAVSGRELLTLEGHTGDLRSVGFSPDGKRILTASEDGTAKVWDAWRGRPLVTLSAPHVGWVFSAAFSPDGKRIVTGNFDGTARVWDAGSGRQLFTIKGHGTRVRSVSFSPDGQRVLTAAADGTAKIWDAASSQQALILMVGPAGPGTRQLEGDGFGNSSATFSPDGKRLLTASRDGRASVRDATSGQQLFTLEGQAGRIASNAFSPDGKRIVAPSGDRTATVWDAATGRPVLTLPRHSHRVWSAGFSPDGQQIATTIEDGTTTVWNARLLPRGDPGRGRKLLTLKGVWGRFAAFSPDGRRIVTSSGQEQAQVWDAASGRELITLDKTFPVWAGAFSPDGKRIVAGGLGATPKVWDASTGREVFSLRGHGGAVGSVVFSPDGNRILTASGDGTAKLWDAATGRELLTLKGHSRAVGSAVFSPDGKRIVTVSVDGTARVWFSDAANGPERQTEGSTRR